MVRGKITRVRLLPTSKGGALWCGLMESTIHSFPVGLMAADPRVIRKMPAAGTRCVVTGLYQGFESCWTDRGAVPMVVVWTVRVIGRKKAARHPASQATCPPPTVRES